MGTEGYLSLKLLQRSVSVEQAEQTILPRFCVLDPEQCRDQAFGKPRPIP